MKTQEVKMRGTRRIMDFISGNTQNVIPFYKYDGIDYVSIKKDEKGYYVLVEKNANLGECGISFMIRLTETSQSEIVRYVDTINELQKRHLDWMKTIGVTYEKK